MKKFIFCSIAILSLLGAQAQDLKIPAPSPPQLIKQDFGLSNIELSYSRPGVKGRKIFGELVPFGKVWRTGANGATTISFGDDVMMAGKKIPAGKYGLLTIPNANDWTIIISKQLDVTNPAAYKQDQDVLRIVVPVNDLGLSVETLTFTFDNMSSKHCDLDLLWDTKIVKIPIDVDVDSKIMADINDAMSKDNRPYFQAATYYMENGKSLDKSLEWFNKAIDQDPDAYYIYYQKARCLAKMGKKQDAIATAQKGIESAKKAPNADYVTLNEKLIASLK